MNFNQWIAGGLILGISTAELLGGEGKVHIPTQPQQSIATSVSNNNNNNATPLWNGWSQQIEVERSFDAARYMRAPYSGKNTHDVALATGTMSNANSGWLGSNNNIG